MSFLPKSACPLRKVIGPALMLTVVGIAASCSQDPSPASVYPLEAPWGRSADLRQVLENSFDNIRCAAEDEWMTLRVKFALFEHIKPHDSELHVSTHRGVVKLSGRVNSLQTAAAAVTLVRNMEDVRGVVEDLIVAE